MFLDTIGWGKTYAFRAMLGFAGDRYAAKRQGSLSVERCPVPLLRYQSHWTRLLKASPVFGKKDGIPSRSCGPSHPSPWSPRQVVLAAARAPKAVRLHGRRRRQRFGRPFARKQPRRMNAKNMTGSNELSVIFALIASRQLQPSSQTLVSYKCGFSVSINVFAPPVAGRYTN